MKTKTKTMLAVLWLSATAFVVNVQAQDAGGPPQGGQSGQGGPGGMGSRRPPPSPVIEALDANHDGTIDADEIANASAALKKLDKNGDGKLTQDEIRPQRPQGVMGGQGQRQQGQRGPGGPGGPGQMPPGGQSGAGQLPPPDGAPQQ